MNDWLYYSSGNQILQKNLYTPEIDVLCRERPGKLYVTEDNFYILAEDGVYLLDITNGKAVAIEGFANAESLTISNDTVYYINGNDASLYRNTLEGEMPVLICEGPVMSFCLLDESVYCAINDQGNGALVRVDAQTGEAVAILETKAEMLHLAEDGIYYLDQTEEMIFRCTFDGRIRKRVSGNRAEDLNIAGGWAFYHNRDDGGTLWCVRIDGANDHPVSSGR